MLVLLIIFMVVTPMLQKGVSVDMPVTNNPRDMQDADKDDAVIVAVTRDGKIFLGNTAINKEDITVNQGSHRQSAGQDCLREERCAGKVWRRGRSSGRDSIRGRGPIGTAHGAKS